MASGISAEKRSINDVLNKLECPFKWKIKIRMPLSSLTLLIKEKEEKCDPSGKEFIWMRLTHCIVLTYVHSINRHYLASLEKINECEDILNELRQDMFFSDILGGLWYVVKAFKAHIYKQQNNLAEAHSVLSAIKPFSQLENSQKAAVYAIIATCKLVCPIDEVQLSEILKTFNKIIGMDPKRGLWYFLKAQCLKEIRLKGVTKFTKEEIENLETMIRIHKTKNPFYLCYAAEEFINIANDVRPSSDEDLYNRAAELYCRVLKNPEHHSLFVLSRILFGYSQLPSQFRTVTIDHIFNKTISLGKDNKDANLALGAYCERVREHFDDALNYYSTALELGSYEAGISMIKLKYKKNGSYNLIQDFKRMRELFRDDIRKQQELLCMLGSWEYLINRNAISAIYYWHAAATLDPDARELQEFRSWICPSKKINIYQAMSIEANYALERIYNWSDLDLKKPKQQQQRTVQLLQHALELCSNFYKSEQNKMFDSSTKLPSGVVTGNTLNMGNYDQCVSVAVNDGDDVHFLGQHCTVSVQFTLAADSCTSFAGGDMCDLIVAIAAAAGLKNWHSRTTVPYHWSYCVPSTCTPSEVNAALSDAFKVLAVPGRVEVTVSVPSDKCLTLWSTRRDFTVADYTFIVTMAIFAVLLTVGTSCDIYLSTRESTEKTTNKFQMTLRAFSVYSNGRELLSTRSTGGTMTSLNGLRFLSICWIIFGHTFYQMSAGPQMNGLDISHYKYKWGMMLVMNATLGTDSFFLLSGALLCYIFMRDRRKSSDFNIVTFYLHRYIRLTPPYAVVVFFYATMFYHVGSGPLWDTWVGVNRDNCVLNWWANLLYVNNYVDVANICMSHSWYLSVDMQLFWVSPVILYPLWKWPRVGQCVLGVALVASVAAPLMVTAVNQLAGAMLYTTNDLMVGQVYIEVYSRMYTRAGPYLVGITLGYLLHHTSGNKLKLSKIMVVVGWCVCTTSLLAVLFGVFGMYQDDHIYNTVEASVYAGFHRTVWAFCVAWILFACVNGYGGPVDAVLSCQLLQPLSRLTYCAYLCHFTFLLLNTGLTKTTGYITVYTVVREYLGNMVLSLATAAALSLTFEIPFLILDKNFLTRRAASSKPLTRDQARASVEAYISRDLEKNVLQDAEKHVESTATGSRVEESKSYTNRGFHH